MKKYITKIEGINLAHYIDVSDCLDYVIKRYKNGMYFILIRNYDTYADYTNAELMSGNIVTANQSVVSDIVHDDELEFSFSELSKAMASGVDLDEAYPIHMCFSLNLFRHSGTYITEGVPCQWDTAKSVIRWYPSTFLVDHIRFIAATILLDKDTNLDKEYDFDAYVERVYKNEICHRNSSSYYRSRIDAYMNNPDKALETRVAHFHMKKDIASLNAFWNGQCFKVNAIALEKGSTTIASPSTGTKTSEHLLELDYSLLSEYSSIGEEHDEEWKKINIQNWDDLSIPLNPEEVKEEEVVYINDHE